MTTIQTGPTSRPAHVLRPDELPSKNRGGGATTIPLVTAERGAASYLNGITSFAPGSQIAHHTHNVAESVMVIQGSAIVDIDGHRLPLRVHDTTFVPANVPHHFENASATAEMKIFWTYGSLDATRTIVGTGEHGRVDGEGDSMTPPERPAVEVASIRVLPGHSDDFERAVQRAAPLFQQAPGARGLTLDRVIEDPLLYRLRITWDAVEHHMLGFRESEAFDVWRALITPHIDGPPRVEHTESVYTGF